MAELEGPGMHAAIARLREAGPVGWVDAIGGWLVTGYRTAVEVLRDAASFTVDDPRFSTAQVVGTSMLSLDGPDHRRHRSPFVPPFVPAGIEERYGPLVEGHVASLLHRVAPRGRADLRPALSSPLAASVMADVVGLGGADADAVLGWYAAIVAAVTAITAGERPGPAAAGALADLGAAVAAGGRSCIPGGAAALSDVEVVSNAAVVLFGGVETVDGAVANVLARVLERPGVLAELRSAPGLLPAAVEESLRLEPAASVVDRYATADVTVGGVEIRRGDLVRVSLAGANRDPEVFADPDEYDLGRANVRSQLSFARGPHACIAMDLARLEARTALGLVLETLPDVRLDGLVEVHGLVFRKPLALPVAW